MKVKTVHFAIDESYYHGEEVIERTLCGYHVKHYLDILRVDEPEQVTCGNCKRWIKDERKKFRGYLVS